MSEADLVARTEVPLTAESLAMKLRDCGLAAGQTVLVHTAMSKFGWIIGGAQAMILALLEVLGEDGTLMMPTHTTSNTDPAEWQHPPVPERWWQHIRDHMPAFDPATSPTRQMGVVAELFRSWPGAIRSNHPTTSFAALGPNAEFLTGDHVLTQDLGERSPIGKLYELDGHVLLLGVDHTSNTSLHLAEYRADYPGKREVRAASAMLVDGSRRWLEYQGLELSTDDFDQIGGAFDIAHGIAVTRMIDAEVRHFRQRALVDFAVVWMEAHRDLSRSHEN
ncbi:MAG: AAC(3) family N-acetyltransferase [Trueperaceae bacterium]|nr:MAG: AAC(3) family N-acetyltransferase [Trueperaceae bacterium]